MTKENKDRNRVRFGPTDRDIEHELRRLERQKNYELFQIDGGFGPTPEPPPTPPPYTPPLVSDEVAVGGDSVFDLGIDDQLWRYHVFLTPGANELVLLQGLEVDIFAVGGGGAGHTPSFREAGGAGGGGGVVYKTDQSVPFGAHAVLVGAGGVSYPDRVTPSTPGGSSIFYSAVAYGGGRGGNSDVSLILGNGGDGGSGGGAGANENPAEFRFGGNGTFGQGFRGGHNFNENNVGNVVAYRNFLAGGGGAGEVGQEPYFDVTSGTYKSGNGGDGVYYPQFNMYGEAGWYGGGAGGSVREFSGQVGIGGQGGGADGVTSVSNGINGQPTSGGGGSGGSAASFGASNGGYGGSGIVIVRYRIATPS